MKVLVTGSRGQLGGALIEALRTVPGIDLTGASRADLDITSARAVETYLRRLEPQWIVNCAAYTDVEKAEDEPEKAFQVNDAAVGFLADGALATGSRLLHLSTDYVFSGRFPGELPRPYRENDVPDPVNVYGASKLAGERRLRDHRARSLVVRTSWLYGGTGKNFLTTMLTRGRRAMAGGEPVRVVDDQRGTPTDCFSLAAQVRELVVHGPPDLGGVVHAACRGVASWWDLTRAIYAAAGWQVPVERIATGDYPSRARRPPYSALENSRLGALGLATLPRWEEGVRAAVERHAPAGGADRQR
jgi:dTDP-4-dehydrorhamnose reductase